MISVLIEGVLHAGPVRRMSARGQPYITARMRATGDDGETVWCSLIAFDANSVEALGRLGEGDALAVAGHASLSVWQGKDGAHKAGLRATVSRVMSVYEAGKKRGGSGGGASPAQGR